MYRTVKSLELVKVEVYGCYIIFSYLYLHKTLILCNVMCRQKYLSFYIPLPYLLLFHLKNFFHLNKLLRSLRNFVNLILFFKIIYNKNFF